MMVAILFGGRFKMHRVGEFASSDICRASSCANPAISLAAPKQPPLQYSSALSEQWFIAVSRRRRLLSVLARMIHSGCLVERFFRTFIESKAIWVSVTIRSLACFFFTSAASEYMEKCKATRQYISVSPGQCFFRNSKRPRKKKKCVYCFLCQFHASLPHIGVGSNEIPCLKLAIFSWCWPSM